MVAAASQPATTTLIQYDSTTTNSVVQISGVYTIADTTDCGAVTCTLKDSTACSAAPTPTITNNAITIASAGDQAITMKKNVLAGYGPIVVCILCASATATSQTDIKTFNSWSI